MAFDFPNPPTAEPVTNPATGVTYQYDAASQTWVVVSSAAAETLGDTLDDLKEDVSNLQTLLPLETSARQQGDAALQGQIDTLNDAPTAVTYQIQTDKILRSGEPAIELVDSEGYFSNVKFEATGGLTVSSSASSIIVDGSGIGDDIDLDNYYNKTEVDNKNQALQIQIDDLKITKGAAAVYTLNDIGIVVGIRPGDFYIDNTVAKNVQFMTFAPEDNNGNDRPLGSEGDIVELVGISNKHYRYEITTAGEGVAGVSFITAEDPDDLLIPGTTFQVYIYPQNSASASVDYVDAGLDTKLSLTGGDLSGTLNTNSLVKSTRTSGYAYLVYDEATETNTAFIHSNGNGRFASGVFTQSVEIRGDSTFKSNINLEGNLVFTSGKVIDATSGAPVLSGRASLDIKTASDYPIVISSGSGYKKVLAFYGFDGSADDNRGETAYINANGSAYFKEVYANDEELATKTYVDGMGQIYYSTAAPSGSDVNNGDLWVDSTNMRLLMRAAGAWVNPDRESDTTEFKQNATPNGRKFGFYNGTGAVTGKLNYFESNGVVKLRLSNTDAFGIKWNDGGIVQDVTMTNGPYFTIWEVVDDTNHKIIRQGRISRIDYHDSDILCYTSSHRTNGGFSTSKKYWVTIGGII